VELITSMRAPRGFPAAVGVATPLMAALYLLLGAVGYWSQGAGVPELVIFGLGDGPVARAAAAAILLQARPGAAAARLAGRLRCARCWGAAGRRPRGSRSWLGCGRVMAGAREPHWVPRQMCAARAQALAQYLVNLNVWTHNILTLLARRAAGCGPGGAGRCAVRTASDHARAPWAVASAVVIAYSAAIAVALPFFSTLVGLVASVTYLTCAYTLPARARRSHARAGAGRPRTACWPACRCAPSLAC